jgi:uncharacterized protein YkwD
LCPSDLIVSPNFAMQWAQAATIPSTMPNLPDLPATEAAIIAMTNAFRQENRLGPVRSNPALAAAARAFARYLATSGTFAHEADGREPYQRAEAQGYRYCLVAENLALNLDSRGFTATALAREVVDGWKNSQSHRENLLQKSASEVGVAVVAAPDRDAKFVSVQMLAQPESARARFTIENRSGVAVHATMGSDSSTLAPHSLTTYETCDLSELRLRVGTRITHLQPRAGDAVVIEAAANGAIRIERSPR